MFLGCCEPAAAIDAHINAGDAPRRPPSGRWKRVQRHQQLAATAVNVRDAFTKGRYVEVDSAERAGIGFVAEADVDAVGAVVDRRLKRRKSPGGTG